MDLFVIDLRITDCISYLTGLHILNLFLHHFCIGFRCFIRVIADHSGDTLRYGLGRHYNDLLILTQIACLVCCKNNVLVVRKDKYSICIYLLDCFQHILGAWVHSLSTLDQVVNTQLTEDLSHTVTNRYRDEAHRFSRLILLLFNRFLLLFSNPGSFFDQLLFMLQTHVINLHIGQCTISQRSLDRQSWIIRMYVYFDNFAVRHDYNRITNGLKICLELQLCLFTEFLVQHDNKLCTIAKLDLSLCLRTDLDRFSLLLTFEGIIHLFARQNVICAFEHLHKSLSAGVYHSCFFQYRKHIRSLCKHCFCLFDNKACEFFHILYTLRELCCLVSSSFCHCKDCSFLRLHNSLIRSLYSFLHSSCQIDHIQLLMVTDAFGKSS